MGFRQPLPFLLALLLLAPGLLVPLAGAAQGDEHGFNLNQPIALPGEPVAFSLHGMPGSVALRVDRLLDPAEVRDFGRPADDLRRETVLARSVQIPSHDAYHSSWGSTGDHFTPPGPGIYLVETERGDVRNRAWLQVAEHSWLVKEGPTTAILHAFRLRDGSPLADARVVANGTEMGRTGADGVLALEPGALAGPVLVYDAEGGVSAGSLGGRGGSSGGLRYVFDSYRWLPQSNVAIHLDRPIYRPGHLVQMKVVAFDPEGDRFVPSDAASVHVRVTTHARGGEEVVHEATLQANDHGSVALAFPLRDDAPLGYYSVSVDTEKGHRGWGGFQVEAYKTPRVKVDVGTPREAYAAGDEVLVRTQATWFFGSPLNRGQVRYAVEPTHGGWYGDCWSCGVGLHHRMAPWGDVERASGTGELRDDGTFTFSYKPQSRIAYPTLVRATVTVTAESGEQQEGSVTFTLHPAAYQVELGRGGYAHEKGAPIPATAIVRDLRGVPAAGVPVSFRLEQESGPARVAAEATTDANGVARATLSAPAQGGGFRLVASVHDAQAREARAETWMWVSDEAARWAGEGDLQVLPERESYRPGETARVLVLAARPMHVLLTVEGADLHDWKVVHVTGGAFVEVPVRDAYAPSVNVVATAFQMGQGGGHGPQPVTREAVLHVAPDPRVLNVTITSDKPVHRDGDEARVLVQVRDRDGRPVAGEVTLAVVDEGIFRLREDQTPSFAQTLYAPRRAVETQYAWWTMHVWREDEVAMVAESARIPVARAASFDGASMAPVVALAGRSSADVKAYQEPVRVREAFPDTALWLPFLRTGEDGTARVRLTAPDTLTEWRLTGRVHTQDGLVGEGKGVFHTRKPLMVELSAPRFLVQGDALNVSAVVFNHMGELRDVEVQLAGTEAARVVGSGYRRVTLSDGDSARIDFPILATDDSSALANLTVVVRSAGADGATEGDAMRLKLPVIPHGVVEKAVRAGVDDADVSLPMPAGPFAAPPSLTVTLSPGMAGAVLDALPYLLGFPYGCVEQTMSRFMPAVVATRALVAAGYDANDPQLPEYVQGGLARLMRFQHADGGWGWWEHDDTHPYMTAYVVAGLSEAKRAGVKVDETAFSRGVQALETLYAREREPDMRAYQAYALALAGAAPSSWPSETEVGLDGLALVGLGKLEAGDRTGARAALDRLMAKAVREEGRLHWSAENAAHWGRHGIRSDVQLTAHALRLMVGLGEEKDAPLAVAWLASQRQGAWWATTKDTSESVLAIVDYLETVDELNPDFDAVVRVGERTFEVPFHGRAKDLKPQTLTVPLPPGTKGPVEVRVDREGEGRLYWTAVLTSTPRAEAILPASHGITVQKRILDAQGKDATALAFNEEYAVRVDVTTPAARSHVLLKDVLPAGVEVVKEQPRTYYPWARALVCFDCGGVWGPWTNLEVRDDHVAAFATTLPAGTSTLSYRVRAVHPGAYHVMPAVVEEMYAPQVSGRSGELHVSIGDVPRVLLASVRIETHALGVTLMGVDPRDAASSLRVQDKDGAFILPKDDPVLTAYDDGSLDVVFATEVPLPDVFTVTVAPPGAPPVVRTFDRTGEAVRFAGTFEPAAAAAWDAGPVVDARTATTRSEPAEPFASIRPAQPREVPIPQREPPLEPPVEDPAPSPLPVPGIGAVATAVMVAFAAALVAGRRRR